MLVGSYEKARGRGHVGLHGISHTMPSGHSRATFSHSRTPGPKAESRKRRRPGCCQTTGVELLELGTLLARRLGLGGGLIRSFTLRAVRLCPRGFTLFHLRFIHLGL